MTPKNKYEFRSLTDVASLDDKTIVGKAICFNDPTCLMEIRGQKYFEVIQPTALDKCNLKDVVLKYNHDNNSQILARTRNKSLELDIRPDGLYFRAKLPETTFAKDMYELVKAGLLSDVSFGFKVGSDRFDVNTCTRSIDTIEYIKEISVVDTGAYSNAYVECESTRDYFTAQDELRKAKELSERKKLLLLTYF